MGRKTFILPNDTEIAISFRTGMQRTLYTSFAEIGEKLIFHFKFIGGMDVGERRKAQLGATTYLIGETKQRLRLSSVGDFSESRELGNSFCTDLVNKLNIFLSPPAE